MGAWSELSHGAPVALFLRCRPIESNEEKTLVESRDSRGRRAFDVGCFDRGLVGCLPTALAPFLEEVWIAARVCQGSFDGFNSDFSLFGLDWLGDGPNCGVRAEWADFGKLE